MSARRQRIRLRETSIEQGVQHVCFVAVCGPVQGIVLVGPDRTHNDIRENRGEINRGGVILNRMNERGGRFRNRNTHSSAQVDRFLMFDRIGSLFASMDMSNYVECFSPCVPFCGGFLPMPKREHQQLSKFNRSRNAFAPLIGVFVLSFTNE
jgi:hypothetical protein